MFIQNLFVLLAIFDAIIQVIKDILKLFFSIPPCDDGDNGNAEKCCSPDVCPSFIKNDDGLVRQTGTLQYYNAIEQDAGLNSVLPSLPAGFLTNTVRSESWQFYDSSAAISDAFINITHAFDLPVGTTQVFFPTDANYQAGTPTNQVPYLVDLRLFYNPSNWSRIDPKGARFIRVNNCIVLKAPTTNLTSYNNSLVGIPNGVLEITGGAVTEDDGSTQVFIDGYNATLNNFIHMPNVVSVNPPAPQPTDGYAFNNVTYTFHIQHEVLLSKGLITLGCIPSVALDRSFVNSVFGGNAGANFSFLGDLINSRNGHTFPDIAGAQSCLTTALSNLRNNISTSGVADFQAATTACLNKLSSDTTSAVNDLLGLGFNQYTSTFSITPTVQFTTLPIKVSVSLLENNGQPLTVNLPSSVASNIAGRIKADVTFGSVDDFVYDGSQFFTANLTSESSGSGTIEISFDNKVFSTATVPADLTQTPTIVPKVLNYTFVYSAPSNSEAPRRDEGDTARESYSNNGD